MTLILVLILLSLGFLWLHLPLKNWLIASSVILFITMVTGITSTIFSFILVVVFIALTALLYFADEFRKQFVTNRLFSKIESIMPPISRTEREAIDAGTVWWDRELFSGAPDWDVLFAEKAPTLSEAEKKFIDGPVKQLCEMSNDWQITHDLNDLPESVWEFIKSERFFGLNAATEFGGFGFSGFAQSCIIQKLSTRSGTVAVTVMVPNSLGPAELIYHYGTEEQKSHYLPRLVNGEEVPCFGLTGPWAGSDADGMPDYGVVCEGTHNGKKVLGFKANWEKRYITLGPVSTLLGLAFKAYDPDHLLGDQEELGITCALVPTEAEGVSIGTRHLPLNASFQNGPNWGKDVFIPMDWIIGGQEMVGQGWRMLMESLAAGRGISLPAAGAGAAKLAVRTTGAYAKIREQFGLEIGKFEGVQEVLGRMGGMTYLIDSGRILITTALALGHKPAVLSAIAKQQCTNLSRIVVNDAMDLHGGKGICMGPGNYLARMYQQIPIGITVEGANILTRSLIIFGQGSIRCHPYLLDEINAIAMEDKSDALDNFDKAIVGHVEYAISNKIRAFGYGLTRGWLAKGAGRGVVKSYCKKIEHLSAGFAYLSDVTLFLLGGGLKRKEMLSGRFADVLSNLYLASAAIKRFRDNGEPEREIPLLEWACQYALYQAQEALDGILRNYPNRIMGIALRITIFPTGRYLKMPSDKLSQSVSELIQSPCGSRDRLTEGIYIPDDSSEIIAQVETAFNLMTQSEDLRRRLKKADLQPNIEETYLDWLNRLKAEATISNNEADLLERTRKVVKQVISVDDFDLAA